MTDSPPAPDAPPPPPDAPPPDAPEPEAPAPALPAPLVGAPPASGPQAPVPPPPAPAARGGCARALALLVVVLVATAVLLPWLLTHSLLTRTLRDSLQRVGGGRSELGRAALGWREGLRLEQLFLAEPPEGAPQALFRELRLETDLIGGARGWWFGTPVSARLVVRDARVDYTVPPAHLAAAPPEASSPGSPLQLPCPLRPSLDVQGFDFACTWTPGDVSPRRLVLRGMRAEGGGQLERDLGMDLDQGFSCQLDGLRLERQEGPEGPAVTLFAAENPSFTTRRLVLPPLALFATNQVQTDLGVKVPVLRAGNARYTDLEGTLAFAEGKARIGLRGAAPVGRVQVEGTLDLRDPARWPTELRLKVEEIQLTGDVARSAPYLVPLLRAHTWAGGRGLPPVTLGLDGRLDLVYDAAGALDGEASLNSLTGKGTFAMGPGTLSSSLLIDGYLRALTGLGVSSLLAGVIPAGWPTSGAEATFELPGGGRVRLPRLVIRSQALDLEVSGETRFSGQFQLTIKTLGEGKQGLAAVLEALDDVGGVRLQGDLERGEVQAVLPDLSEFLEAARKRGVLELLQEKVSGGSLKEALEQLKGLPEGIRSPR